MLIWGFIKKIQLNKKNLKGVITINDTKIVGELPGIECKINIKSNFSLLKIFFEDDIGLGKVYRDGDIEIDNLTNFFRFIIQNEQIFEGSNKNPLNRIKHFLNKNTKSKSKKNIENHYDLGNDFYSLWLDETMSYSAAYWSDNKNKCLKEAQESKYNLYIDDLIGNSVLEVGAGWGGFVKSLKQTNPNFSYTGLSLSTQQTEIAKLYGNVLIQDYRDHNKKYDNVVSIEMFEAVGKEYWDVYFKKIYDNLNENGIAQIQVITIDESRYSNYQNNSDFIKHFIFPGGFLPTKSLFIEHAEKNGLKEIKTIEFPIDYAQTLKLWHENFDKSYDKIKLLGYDDKFIRIWKMYLSICEAGFLEGRISLLKTNFIKDSNN